MKKTTTQIIVCGGHPLSPPLKLIFCLFFQIAFHKNHISISYRERLKKN